MNDIVLLKDEDLVCGSWPMARIVKVFPDKDDGLVRSVELWVSSKRSTLKRPIKKIVLLVAENETK